MIYIDYLNDLITTIPNLLDLFLSGFVFMCIYIKIHNKHLDISMICLWSLFISYLIKCTCSVMHNFIFTSYNFDENLKVLIYVLIAVILSIVVTLVYKSETFGKILLKLNHQTVNDDIFDDLIDYELSTSMYVYLKDVDYYCVGSFCIKEEKGKDSYISLVDYVLVDIKSNEVIYKPSLPSSVVFNLSDIERIELIYNDNSKVWERLSSGN